MKFSTLTDGPPLEVAGPGDFAGGMVDNAAGGTGDGGGAAGLAALVIGVGAQPLSVTTAINKMVAVHLERCGIEARVTLSNTPSRFGLDWFRSRYHQGMTAPARRGTAIEAGLQFGLRNRWHPVFESRDLPVARPIAIVRLGEQLALWRDATGKPHLFIDRCPHRGAAFSEGGTVHGEELQCWYHGFRYDGTGQCTAVPVEGEQTALASRVSITSYPVEERWGMIWAYIGEVDLFPPPPLVLPYEMTAPDWAGHVARATWRANWLLVLDNLMDPMHASWLHAKSYTLSKGKKSARLAVRDLDDGFVVERENQRGVNFDWTEYHDTGSLWFRLEIPYPRSAGPGGPFRILGWSTPIDGDRSLSYFLRMRHVSGWQRRLWDMLYGLYLERNHWNVLEQDRRILESQRGLSSRLWEHMAQTDIGVVRLRRMLNEAFWKQQEIYLSAAASGRKPSSGERVKALLAGREAVPV